MTQSLVLGSQAPDFILFDVVTQKNWALSDIFDRSRPLLVMMLCNHCPYVKHIEEEIAKLTKEYSDQITPLAICANDVSFLPDDSPDELRAQAERLGFNFPYFYDDRQEIVKAFNAYCTPDFYLFSADNTLVYHGQFDESRPGNNIETNGKSLRYAIDTLLADEKISTEQTPSVGCSIKWRPGNEPDYYRE